MEQRLIGTSNVAVSPLSLGSWNTYSRLSFEANIDLINHAYTSGITFFDVAYYRDKPHTEVLFGRMLEEANFTREDIVLAEKVWFHEYPERDLDHQLDGSLKRLAVDDVDVIIVEHLREGIDLHQLCRDAAQLVTSGRAKIWGVLNWGHENLLEAHNFCKAEGIPGPQVVQIKYSVVRQNVVDSPAYQAVLAETGISVMSSDTLEGGILAGNLHPDRGIGIDIGGIREDIRARVPELQEIAQSFDVTPAEFAIAFSISKQQICSLLFGATKPSQIDSNIRGLQLAMTRGAEVREAALALSVAGHHIDPPYQGFKVLTDEYVA